MEKPDKLTFLKHRKAVTLFCSNNGDEVLMFFFRIMISEANLVSGEVRKYYEEPTLLSDTEADCSNERSTVAQGPFSLTFLRKCLLLS